MSTTYNEGGVSILMVVNLRRGEEVEKSLFFTDVINGWPITEKRN